MRRILLGSVATIALTGAALINSLNPAEAAATASSDISISNLTLNFQQNVPVLSVTGPSLVYNQNLSNTADKIVPTNSLGSFGDGTTTSSQNPADSVKINSPTSFTISPISTNVSASVSDGSNLTATVSSQLVQDLNFSVLSGIGFLNLTGAISADSASSLDLASQTANTQTFLSERLLSSSGALLQTEVLVDSSTIPFTFIPFEDVGLPLLFAGDYTLELTLGVFAQVTDTVTSPPPPVNTLEPSTVGVLGMGLLGMVCMSKAKRAKRLFVRRLVRRQHAAPADCPATR